MNLIAQCVYYRVKYLDAKKAYPVVQSFVFLGKDLSDDDDEDTWYFQELADYQKHGSALTASKAGTPVVCLTFDAFGDDMFDVEQLRDALHSAHRRCLEES